jgi:hypothetical protein
METHTPRRAAWPAIILLAVLAASTWITGPRVLAQSAPTPDPNIPPVIRLEASASTIPAGTGVTVRAWVQRVTSANLDGQPVMNGYLEVLARLCADRTFTLETRLLDGSTDTRSVTVGVTGECVDRPTVTPGPTPVRPQNRPSESNLLLKLKTKVFPYRTPLPTIAPWQLPYRFNPNDLQVKP